MISIVNAQLINKFVDEHFNTQEDSGKLLKAIYGAYLFQRQCKAMNDVAKELAKVFDGLREALLTHDITLIIDRRDYQTEKKVKND